ncbi:uncharacterized protein LOC142344477 [Convolutriloba macropyga]|uniref:uncharacterized protein LOC142344477 n=1 Tax=Convolutriloba macropyga TaxID=536237 RepID=UPI003F51D684
MDKNDNQSAVDVLVNIAPKVERDSEFQDCLCPICKGELNKPRVTKCGHVFCKRCLTEVKERQLICPLCRAPLEPEKVPIDGRRGQLPKMASKQPDRVVILFGFTILVALAVLLWYGIKKLFVMEVENHRT